ncbi:hypothetical protein [Bradyrhizobium sp. LTSPM299]|jgi:hypothetical protein|uniref:hypothetical protein n=1 Tax=Bradyrhizobium sp. LTSPM299 TaxID=1619233 RepID=UPI0005C80BC7|nr:hypothetical protein [Bradyrhizobium sp. LTSPM299]
MPFGSEGVEAGLGLALSGGGFRATLFHIGSCWRLIELGIAKDPTTKSYQDLVVAPLREFCGMHIGTLRTRLNPFDDTEQEQLINWGCALCDAAIRKHARQIVKTQAKPTWPCPGHPLG